MDTKRLEMVAEDLVSSILQQRGILVAKPKFDRLGTDLFAMSMSSVEEPIRLCRIQCKGRSLHGAGSGWVEIPQDHVSPSFMVFLYVDVREVGRYHLYCFSADDLRKPPWKQDCDKRGKERYTLSIAQATFQERLKVYLLDQRMIEKVRTAVDRSTASEELRYVFENQGLLRGQGDTPGQGVRIENVGGLSIPIIRNRATRTERAGTECPGNPDDFDYDASADTWRAK